LGSVENLDLAFPLRYPSPKQSIQPTRPAESVVVYPFLPLNSSIS